MFLIFCVLVALSAQDTYADCPQIIGRKEWDAVKPEFRAYLTHPVDLVIIQHTVTQSCSNDKTCTEVVRDLQKTHIEQAFLWDIGPSFLVGGTGKLYEGRGWYHTAMHTPGYNNQSIGIAFIGNFNNQEPSSKALTAAQALIKCGVDEELLTPNHKVVVHSQLLSTESPGKKLASKVMSWSDWTNDVSEIKKRADKQDDQQGSQTVNQQSRSENELALTSPKKIDLLSNLRDVIAELILNMSKLAHGTVDTIKALAVGVNKEASLFVETLASGLKKLRDQVEAAISTISGVPGVSTCAESHRKETNKLYDDTETKAKACADRRIKEINDMINNLGTLSSKAIDYTNTAVENTKNCTELNYGITESTKHCLNSVTQQTKSASETYESQRSSSLNSIQTLMGALPDALNLCAKQHLLEAGTGTTQIVSGVHKCISKGIRPSFINF